MDSFLRVTALLVLLAILPFAPARAQGEHSVPPATNPPSAQAPAQSLPPEPDTEVTILRDEYAGKYNSSTLDNLAKMYWRLGAFDMEDGEAVGNFIKINECKLYAEYVNDDLEWKEIVKTMTKHIEKNKEAYPLNFQFVLQLHLGRYDPALGGFTIVDKTGFKNAKRIEVDSIDNAREVCYDQNPIKDYPKSLIILLPKPFTLDFVKLDEHVAQAYILRKKSEFSQLSDSQRLQQYERDAYLRLRITFSQYHGNLRAENGRPMAILYGKIDGYDIFEDAKQKRLMLSVDLTQQANAAAPAMSVPVEPLSEIATAPTQIEGAPPQPTAPVEAAPTTTVVTTTTAPVATPVTAQAPAPSVTTTVTTTAPATGMGFAATPSP